MLEIKPIQLKEEQKLLCRAAETEYSDTAFAYSAYDGDKFIGISQFEIEGDTARIINISQAPGVDDFEGMFIMGRAVLNFLDLCSVKYAVLEPSASSERLSLAIGFSHGDDGGYKPLCLTGMFDAKCKPHNK